jgi:hypothetical protein
MAKGLFAPQHDCHQDVIPHGTHTEQQFRRRRDRAQGRGRTADSRKERRRYRKTRASPDDYGLFAPQHDCDQDVIPQSTHTTTSSDSNGMGRRHAGGQPTHARTADVTANPCLISWQEACSRRNTIDQDVTPHRTRTEQQVPTATASGAGPRADSRFTPRHTTPCSNGLERRILRLGRSIPAGPPESTATRPSPRPGSVRPLPRSLRTPCRTPDRARSR